MKRRSAEDGGVSGVVGLPSRRSFETHSSAGDASTGPDDDNSKHTEKRRAAQPSTSKAKAFLVYLLLLFFIFLSLALSSGGGTRLAEALGWKRSNRVALLTVATHLPRLSESADSESEYGASKTAFSYPFSVDNKARYCALHQYDLNIDVLTGADDGTEGDEAGSRSSRFRKLALIRQLWRSYDWLVWMDIDALFLDPSVDVLSLLDKTADLHFTLEPGGGGVERVNTGFFAVRTTEFSREFFERAWTVNDCGRGQSDQRSINFVLGKVNADDGAFCSQSAARAEWRALAASHGGEAAAAGKVRYYKKALLNAFPRDVGKHLVPVDRYALPDAPGDETAVSLVVHFAGQYGGARTVDGAMTVGMLVQYLHLLSTYHGAFLDRVQAVEAKAALAAGDHKTFHAFHDEHPAQAKVMARAAALKARAQHRQNRHSPGGHARRSSPSSLRSSSASSKEEVGPKTVQDAVWEEAGSWTRSPAEARQRVAALEAMLERECLTKIRNDYVDAPADPVTGKAFKEPPRLAKPPLHRMSALRMHAHVDERGNARPDPAKTCDYVGTLSRARQHLAQLLPDTPAPAARWPRALLCAAPLASDPADLVGRLNATRLWLEMRRPSTLAKLQFGAPFFEDDQGGGSGLVGGGGGETTSFANPLDAPWDATPMIDDEERRAGGRGGLPLGPSLYASLDVSAPSAGQRGEGKRKTGSRGGGRGGGDDDEEEESSSESEDGDAVGGHGMDDEEDDAELERGALDDRLLVAAAECAFLDPAKGVVVEKTFAYSAVPDRPPGKQQRSFFEGHSRFAAAPDSPAVFLPSSSSSSLPSAPSAGPPPVRDAPGAVFLPPMSARHAEALEHALAPGRGAPGSFDDDGGLLRAYNGFEEALGLLTFWTYTAPLLCRLLAETPPHVVVVVPGSGAMPGGAAHTRELLQSLEVLHLPPRRILLTGDVLLRTQADKKAEAEGGASSSSSSSSRAALLRSRGLDLGGSGSGSSGLGAAVATLQAGTLVYADTMLTLHATMPLAAVATQQLTALRKAATPPESSPYRDPSDDLVICVEEVPLDVPLNDEGAGAGGGGGGDGAGLGRGTLVSDWFMVRAALQDALPNDNVASYDARKGFAATDASAVEFFRRAKLVVVAAGVVPSLLLALFSSEGIPVIELVGKASLQAHDEEGEAGGGEEGSSQPQGWRGNKKMTKDRPAEAKDHFGEGDHDVGGWDWTKAVLAGLGHPRVSVTSTFTDGSGGAVFDPEEVVDAALSALNLEQQFASSSSSSSHGADAELEGPWRREDDLQGGGNEGGSPREAGDDEYKDEVDDLGGKPDAEAKSGGESEEEEEEEEESAFLALSDEVRALVTELSPTLGGERGGEKGHVAAELGLFDRDRLGELLQRLGDPATAPREEEEGGGGGGAEEGAEGSLSGQVLGPFSTLGGAIVGAEFGDFALQVLRRWTRCPSWLVLDAFDDEEVGSARKASVTKVLAPWLARSSSGGGGSEPVATLLPPATLPEDAVGGLADGSLAMVYLDSPDKSARGVAAELRRMWTKLAPGGMAAGHDFTRAHSGVAEAVVQWVAKRGLTLFLTDVQRPRTDVLGNELPPCCPSWYFFKPLDHDDEGSGEGGSLGGSGVEAAARRIAEEINFPTTR